MSMSTVKDDPALTPGEQRILTLMGQGFGRLEQRQQVLENKLEAQTKQMEVQAKQLLDLTSRVSQEAAASKQRDRQLSADIQRLREQAELRDINWRQTFHGEMNAFRVEVSEKFDQHNTRLEMLEQAAERANSDLRHLDQRLDGLQQEQHKLNALLGREYASHGQPSLIP
ncbi:hypothetical protein [Cystobacter fuscus]|nr:hypothetical protein [Cystobacter fuscus]